MNQQNRRLIMLGIVGVVVIGLLWAGGWYLANRKFKLIQTTPNLQGDVPSSSGTIKLEFNKKIDTSVEYTDNLAADMDAVQGIDIEDKSVLIHLKSPLDIERTYHIVVRDIKSTSGQTYTIDFVFRPKYVPFNKLSKADQEFQTSQTDRNNSEDPLAVFLPYQGSDFYLAGEYGVNDEELPIFIVNAQLFLRSKDLGPNRSAAINRITKSINDFIASKGFDPAKYNIRYNINEVPSAAR